MPAKDQMTLIRAIPYIEDPDAFIVFAGDGPEMKKAKELARELEVNDRCIFLGNRDDVPILMGAAYIGIQSSHWEGFGLTAVEFMASEKPVIASNVDGLKQVVEKAGLLFQMSNAIDLAEKINKLISDSNLYNDIKNQCIKRAQLYSIESIVKKYLEEYQNLLRTN